MHSHSLSIYQIRTAIFSDCPTSSKAFITQIRTANFSECSLKQPLDNTFKGRYLHMTINSHATQLPPLETYLYLSMDSTSKTDLWDTFLTRTSMQYTRDTSGMIPFLQTSTIYTTGNCLCGVHIFCCGTDYDLCHTGTHYFISYI